MRIKTIIGACGAIVCTASILMWASRAKTEEVPNHGADFADVIAVSEVSGEPTQPIPTNATFDPRKLDLGRKLFHDKRLSGDNTISCASCHDLQKGGTDQAPHSTGIHGAVGGINSPSVYNSGLNFKQFWNGRAATLEDQVNGPTHNPAEMGSNWDEILGKLKTDVDYPRTFTAIYPDGIVAANVRDAIATFERSLLAINSPFDRYLRGDQTAISEDAKKGYRLFKSYGCTSCHQGMNLGGNMYQKFGIVDDYIAKRGHITENDYGRFNVTKREEDRFVFRVPSLRNVSVTGPYFHDASAKTLEDAVEVMADYQIGRYVPGDDLRSIVQFLNTLTGEYNGQKL